MRNTKGIARVNHLLGRLLAATFLIFAMILAFGCAPAPYVDMNEPEGESGDYFNPAGIYEDSVLLGNESRPGGVMEGFKISDVRISHRGTTLPEGVSTDMLTQGGWIWEAMDEDGTLSAEYEYLFITYRLTNEAKAEEWFMLNAATLYVLGDEYKVIDGGGEVCYLNGKDLAAADRVKDKKIAQETLKLGESKTYTVAFVMESDVASKGTLWFVPDNSLAMTVGDPILPYQGIKLEG